MFKVTAVSYRCSDSNTERDENFIYVTEAETSTAPMPELLHPIDFWWVHSGNTYRTPFMTGSTVGA